MFQWEDFGWDTFSWSILPLGAGVLSVDQIYDRQVALSWTAATGETFDVISRLQRRQVDEVMWINAAVAASPAIDGGLLPDTAYDYRVLYIDGLGTIVYSNVERVTTGTQEESVTVAPATGGNIQEGITPAESPEVVTLLEGQMLGADNSPVDWVAFRRTLVRNDIVPK